MSCLQTKAKMTMPAFLILRTIAVQADKKVHTLCLAGQKSTTDLQSIIGTVKLSVLVDFI